MNKERVATQKSNNPRRCVAIMIPNTMITGLFLFFHFINGDGEVSFSLGSKSTSYIHAASTHVLNP